MATALESIGRVVQGRYRIEAVLGAGGTSQVFSAVDVSLGRRVALKVLHPSLAHEPAFLRRFAAEARAVAALAHPHVVALYDWGEDDIGPFLVLEHLDGGSLRDLLDDGVRLEVPQAVRVGGEAASALAYAHARGIVHRDVKPENLMLDWAGRVKVADFGVARALADAALTEPSGTMVGTTRYAAPEQALGRPLDGRSDVYALALVLYEVVTGCVPFVVDTAAGSLMARVGRRLPAHDALGPLADVLLEAAAPDPADRLDAEAFGRRLASLAEVLGEPAPLPMPTRLAARLRERGAADEVLWASRGTGEPTLVPPPNALPSRGLDAPPQRAGDAAPLSGQAQLSAEERGGLGSARGGPGPAPLLGTDPGPRGRARAAMRGDQVGPAGRRRLGRVLVVAAVLLALVAGGGSIAAWRVGWFLPVRRVPQVIGSSVRIAEARLARAGFRPVVSARTHDVSVPQGAVVSERPAAGRRLRVRSRVELVVSLGPPPVAVPSLARAHGCKDVAQLLEAAHLRAACSQAPSTSVPAGEVVSWSPHRSAPWGSTVQVVVSSGPPMVQVPDLAGSTCAAAKQALSAVGLVGACSQAPSTSVPAGEVVSWSPHRSAPWGSTVQVVVSSGPPMVQVPDVTGDTVPVAIEAIQRAGLVAGNVYGPASGTVFHTNPSAGSSAPEGSSVDLYTQ